MKPWAKYTLGLILLVLLFCLIKFGRSWYVPALQKLKGKETVASVVEKIGADVQSRLKPKLSPLGYASTFPKSLLLLAYKEERQLNVYAVDSSKIRLIVSYPFTAYSGELGPKLREGDRQIPEGIYAVEYINPNSAYHLSIKLDYPNAFDREQSQLEHLAQMGGDIFIHGKSVTVGCIPIGDEAIEELFVLVSEAGIDNVRVIISPRDFVKNKTYPEIDGIAWEVELYDSIYKALMDAHGMK